jgi:hypothetical protein
VTEVVRKWMKRQSIAEGEDTGGLKSNAFKDWGKENAKDLYPGGIAENSPGSRSEATTTPVWVVSSIGTLKGVRETWESPLTNTPSPTHYRGRILLFTRFSGCSSLPLLDPELISSIPAGIKNHRREMNP